VDGTDLGKELHSCGAPSQRIFVHIGAPQGQRRLLDSTVNDSQELPRYSSMTQITARVPEELVAELDRAAVYLARSRADVIRQAIEYYLDDLEDLSLGLQALRDPADPVLDWEDVRTEVLGESVASR
jgi:transposase